LPAGLRMKKKVSLKDIAKKLGVSTTLVSYVLNGKMKGRISEETTAKILKTAASLNYRPNQIAKSLKTSKTNTIGLIVSDISNPFFSQLARIIEDEAEKNNYTVIFGSSDGSPERSQKLIHIFLDRQVDGIILAPVEQAESQIKELLKNKVPLVLIDRYFPEIEANYVALDNYQAAFRAVSHLIENKVKCIGMIGYDSSLFHLQERKRGYLDALKKNKLPHDISTLKMIRHNLGREAVEQAIDELLNAENPPDGLFFASNMIASQGIKYINTLSLRVPDDLAIVCFDETEAADLFYSPLTYVKQPLFEMGQSAIRILLKCMFSPKIRTQQNFEAELVIRQSSLKKG
jgi:LacI family transcriptional regulator